MRSRLGNCYNCVYRLCVTHLLDGRRAAITADIDDLAELVQVPRTDPLYNCHGYLTKIPIDAIVPFIKAFSRPGDVVADFFAGSGMTGLAALTLGRHARLSDISVLGQHISSGYLAEVDDSRLLHLAAEVSNAARHATAGFYHTLRAPDGAVTDLVRTVWSFTYVCPLCGYELIYFEHVNGPRRSIDKCPRCDTTFSKKRWARFKDVPVEVVVLGSDGKQKTQAVSSYDLQKIVEAEKDPRLHQVPSQTIAPDREMYSRSGLGKSGLTETKMFFSARNAISLLELWSNINRVADDAVRQKLCFAFTAILPRASMRYQWSAKRPLNAQNQTYYIAPVYYEWNVFDLFQRKIKAVRRAATYLSKRIGVLSQTALSEVTYTISSADNLAHLTDQSIDYIFTDPPFGSNIYYSDMNLFQEAWLGATTDYTSEAVIHTTGSRKVGSVQRYEKILRDAFREGWRVLKPGGHMSVVFGNSRGRIWGSVQRALREIGFDPAPVHVAILDKGQRSVKGLNSGTERVVTADLILTMRKPFNNSNIRLPLSFSEQNAHILVARIVRELKLETAPNPSHVYALVIREAIRHSIALDDLHFSDILIALRNAGYRVDNYTGMLVKN